jgi:uncharacterized membrane protein (UPF0127 family)
VRAELASRRAAAPLALSVCTGPVERARGLLGRPEPAPGTALWIRPCRAIHTFGMRYAIDVAFLDDRGLVLRVEPGVATYRVLSHRGASSVLELRAGECQRLALRPGERLVLPAPPSRPASAATQSGPRPVLMVGLALVLAMAWMLGGCAATPPERDRPGSRAAAATLPPDDELALVAGLEYDSRAWPAAEAAYAELARREPTNGEHWYRLGVIYLHTARADAGARALEIAVQLGARPGSVQQSLASARLLQALQALRLARAGALATPPGASRTVAATSADASSMDAAIASVERLLPVSIVRVADHAAASQAQR